MKINLKMTNLRKNNLNSKSIGLQLVDKMDQITFDRIGEKSLSNIKYNLNIQFKLKSFCKNKIYK